MLARAGEQNAAEDPGGVENIVQDSGGGEYSEEVVDPIESLKEGYSDFFLEMVSHGSAAGARGRSAVDRRAATFMVVFCTAAARVRILYFFLCKLRRSPMPSCLELTLGSHRVQVVGVDVLKHGGSQSAAERGDPGSWWAWESATRMRAVCGARVRPLCAWGSYWRRRSACLASCERQKWDTNYTR